MNPTNQIIIEGNVVRDTQVKETPRGTRVCVISMATNRFFKDTRGELQKEVGFFDVEAWGENFCNRIISKAKKGIGLRVIGRLKQDRWKSANGKSNSKISIIAEHIDFKTPIIKSPNQDKQQNDAKIAAMGMMAESEAYASDGICEDEAVF